MWFITRRLAAEIPLLIQASACRAEIWEICPEAVIWEICPESVIWARNGNSAGKVGESTLIELKEISKIYTIGDETVYALDHASMSIQEGEFVSIIGPSGSGKSTMMNIIGCLDVADEGEYILDGISIEQYSERELARIRNHKLGFIFQNFNLLPRLTAEENVELPLLYQGVKAAERKERVRKALEKVELSHRMHHRPTELSGGQQQRVAIARALVTKPSLFLADEPTGNLDSRTGQEIMCLFHELHEVGNTIVLITHDNGVAQEAERMIRIRDGHVDEVTA